MNKSLYTIIAVVAVFAVFLGVAVWYKNGGTLSVPVPTIEVTSADHKRGEGPVVLMEYSDFQCPACGAYYPVIERVIAERASTTTYVYRHFPLPQHANAYPAAEAAEAAGRQGKFEEMYHKLFENQAGWSELSATEAYNVFLGYAKDLGLDEEKFATDFKDKSLREVIQADYKSGTSLNVDRTPSFFINGKKIDTPTGNDIDTVVRGFEALIDAAYAESFATTSIKAN